MRPARVVSLFLLALASGGCDPSSDADDASREDDLTVRPTGTPAATSEVVLELPPNQPTTFAVAPYSYTYSFAFRQWKRVGSKVLGTVNSLTPGQAKLVWPSADDITSCLEIMLVRRSSRSDTNPTVSKQELCDATFTAGKRTSIALGTAKLWWTGYPNAWMGTTDIVLLRDTARVTGQAGTPWYFDARYPADPRYVYQQLNDVPLLFAPGTYTYAPSQTTSAGSRSFEVKALQQVDANFGNDDRLATVQIAHETGGEFGTWNMTRSLTCGDRTVTYAPGTQRDTLTTRVLLATDTTQCALTASTGSHSVSMPFSVAIGQTLQIGYKRLDIDDAHLSDGTTRKATVNVRRQNENGGWSDWLFGAHLDSKIGMLLPPGHYQVRAQWPGGEQDNEVDL